MYALGLQCEEPHPKDLSLIIGQWSFVICPL